MKVIVLTNDFPTAQPLVEWLKDEGENVSVVSEKYDISSIGDRRPDFIISYRYRFLIGSDVIDIMDDSIINLHLSYLPYNKGADSNIWSFIDGTMKGVTIHKVDKGLDTGDILVQEEIKIDESETLAGSYARLQEALLDMFISNWKYLREKRIIPQKQASGGTTHTKSDLNKYRHILEKHGYGITIKEFIKLCGKVK